MGQRKMQSSSIRVLILRAHLVEMIISIFFIGLVVFMRWGRSNSDVHLLAGVALLVAGDGVSFRDKSILKPIRR
jgi:hypothetical protein